MSTIEVELLVVGGSGAIAVVDDLVVGIAVVIAVVASAMNYSSSCKS